MTTTMVVLNVSVLILLAALAWAMVRLYKTRLTSIEQELRAITTLLGQLPGDSGLLEQLSAHEKQLRGIGEQLHSHPDTELLHRYLQDQTDQLLAIISTCESGRKPELTRADLEQSLRLTNQKLERVLWALRFDEEKYQGSTEAKKDRSETPGTETNKDAGGTREAGRNDQDAAVLAKSMKDGGDSYQAMLDYMRTTGKSGADALHALEMARVIHGR